jgi:alcohol dehydrogenase (quinone), cytochrome c subunit
MKLLRAPFGSVALLIFVYATAPGADMPAPASAANTDVAAVAANVPAERGKYLADAGNCVSCHTRRGGEPFSGGVSFDTPFGKIYSTNITPDRATGIGAWSSADLRRAMHLGIAADGDRLFPAFPYTSFTKVSDADVEAIYAYLRTLKSVQYTPPANDFLLTQRWGLRVWNYLYFQEGRFSPIATESGEWNRGAYLVEGLGHCSACHTPRNFSMAEAAGKEYAGGAIKDAVAENKNRDWSAVNLTSAKSGLGSWSVEDLAKYLRTGFSQRGGAFGPMNEVIVNSLSKLAPEDVHAMAIYLKGLPPKEYQGKKILDEQIKAGASIYKQRCEKCHSASGRGGIFSGPPLAGSAVVQAEDPSSLINIIVYGPQTAKEVSYGAWETMKPYADVLDDAQVADVSNYVRGSWGNLAGPVTAEQVAKQR